MYLNSNTKLIEHDFKEHAKWDLGAKVKAWRRGATIKLMFDLKQTDKQTQTMRRLIKCVVRADSFVSAIEILTGSLRRREIKTRPTRSLYLVINIGREVSE